MIYYLIDLNLLEKEKKMAKRKKQKSLVARLAGVGLGLGLILFTVALILSCVFYNQHDSGYNIANSREVRNFLGAFGAYNASWILGWFGFALPIFFVAPIVWGYEIIRYRVFMHSFGRVVGFIIGFFFVFGFFEFMFWKSEWF